MCIVEIDLLTIIITMRVSIEKSKLVVPIEVFLVGYVHPSLISCRFHIDWKSDNRDCTVYYINS